MLPLARMSEGPWLLPAVFACGLLSLEMRRKVH